jgi:hypothetical protein
MLRFNWLTPWESILFVRRDFIVIKWSYLATEYKCTCSISARRPKTKKIKKCIMWISVPFYSFLSFLFYFIIKALP